MLLNALPFHSFLHSLALFASRNFIKTMYLLARAVLINRKWLTCSLVCSPTKPKRSEGAMYDGTASIQSVVHCCSSNSPSNVSS